jgi:putative addiction module component (TIGR02574 family)
MTPTLQALGIDRLSAGERLELIELIWNSLPVSVSPEEVPDWHLAELTRRRADAEAIPARANRGDKFWIASADTTHALASSPPKE